MLSNNQKKLITSLHQKKQRDKHGLLLVEGKTIIGDLLNSGELNGENAVLIAATSHWIDQNQELCSGSALNVSVSSEEDLKKVSTLVTPPEVIALVRFSPSEFTPEIIRKDYTLYFDSVRDPGNMGTILRTADWFGFSHVLVSRDSVDVTNPKVIQASMGAFMRIKIHYLELEELAQLAARFRVPLYGTTMDGTDFYETPIKNPGVILFGNESRGLNQQAMAHLKERIRIPDYPVGKSGSESLNVALSAGIVCSELRRRAR